MMPGTLYYKGIAGIDSMQEMTEKFNDEAVSKNLSVFMGETAKEYVPCHVTEKAYLERLDPAELEEIKQRFPRLPILLLADSLYASKQVMELSREYKWEFLIRHKKGSIPSIAEEYEKIPEKGKTEKAEFVNEIDYEGKPVHVLRYREEGEGEITEFQWLCSIKISKENAEKMAEAGRKRWKIENEGFNRQKNWQADTFFNIQNCISLIELALFSFM